MLSKVWPVGQDRDFMIEIMDIKKKSNFTLIIKPSDLDRTCQMQLMTYNRPTND